MEALSHNDFEISLTINARDHLTTVGRTEAEDVVFPEIYGLARCLNEAAQLRGNPELTRIAEVVTCELWAIVGEARQTAAATTT